VQMFSMSLGATSNVSSMRSLRLPINDPSDLLLVTRTISEHCRSLASLALVHEMHDADLNVNTVNTRDVAGIVHHLGAVVPRLKDFTVSGFKYHIDLAQGICRILNDCPLLETLDMDCICDVPGLLYRLPSLRTLCLRLPQHGLGDFSLSGPQLAVIARGCPGLTALDLNSTEYTASVLASIFHLLPELRYGDLTQDYEDIDHIPASGLSLFLAGHPKLRWMAVLTDDLRQTGDLAAMKVCYPRVQIGNSEQVNTTGIFHRPDWCGEPSRWI
jgi:hypothetical protein